MNYFPAAATSRAVLTLPATPAARAQFLRIGTVLLMTALLGPALAGQPKGSASARQSLYDINYRVTPDPRSGRATVELSLQQSAWFLREMNMRAPRDRIDQVQGDGQIEHRDGRVIWSPPKDGGVLSWSAAIAHERSRGGYDSFIDKDWAVFRADDIIPSATTRTLKGARSKTSLTFVLPRRWSSVTQYFGQNNHYQIRNAERRFDRPTGWVALGRIGVRNEDIGGIRVIVAGPIGHNVRRMDMLALLRWTLPEISRVFPEFPGRLTIVSAGEPMWRGGLSAPASLFLHAERPMISENATSTLVHELVHVGLGRKADANSDWIVEGLAELYSLEALRRSGTISARRFQIALDKLAERGNEAESLCVASSRGAVTAKAVTVLHELDREIIKNTDAAMNLDDLLQELAASEGDLSTAALRDAATGLLGRPARSLEDSAFTECD